MKDWGEREREKESMDTMGDHAVSCKFGPSRIARHDRVNKAWAFALKGAGMAVKMEVYFGGWMGVWKKRCT